MGNVKVAPTPPATSRIRLYVARFGKWAAEP